MLIPFAAVLLSSAPACLPDRARPLDTIRVATYAYPNVDRRASASAVAAYLGRGLRRPTRSDVYPDPVALSNAVAKGDADIGLVNVFGYLLLSLDSTSSVPLAGYRLPADAVPYEAAIASRVTLAELRSRASGLRMAFVSPASSTGNLFPRLYLGTLGIDDPEKTFKSVAYAGTHAKAFDMLRDGEADVAALAGQELDTRLAGVAGSDIKVIWRSGNIPLGPVVASCRVGASQRDSITMLLGQIHRSDSAAFAALKGGWVEARAADALVPVTDAVVQSFRQFLTAPARAERLILQLSRP